MSLGLGRLERRFISSEAPLEREIRQVEVDAVVPEPDESLRDELRFESCDGFRVISHEDGRRLASNSLNQFLFITLYLF